MLYLDGFLLILSCLAPMENEHEQTPNFFKDFAQARKLMKHTSRGKNPDWYRRAIDLNSQLHLFPNPTGFRAFLRISGQEDWQEVSQIPKKHGEEFLASYLEEIRISHLPRNSRSLGVILHLNTDVSVFEFPLQDWENLAGGQTLDQLIADDPGMVLQDRTQSGESMSFRAYPVPASPQVATSGYAVASNRYGEKILTQFRELGNASNFPVQTHALNSPLLLLSRLPRTLGPQETAFCTLLRFDEFSFCGFFTANGELVLLRSLKHIGGELPQNLETVLATNAASVEIAEMVIKAFDCRSTSRSSLEEDLTHLLFQLSYQVFLPPSNQEQALPIELSVFDIEDDNPDLGFGDTETFGATLADDSHLQDYLPALATEKQAVPGPIDMKVLRIGRILTRLAAAACIAFCATAAVSSLKKTSSVEWKTNATKDSKSAQLTAELKKLKKMERLLAARSKGWVTMELYSRLFPLDGTIQFSSANYAVSTQGGGLKAGTKGFTKKWTIQGLAENSTAEGLSRINTQEGMEEVFEEVKNATGSSSMDLNAITRNALVNLDLSENQSFEESAPKGAKQSFAYRFNLEVTQRIEAGDSLAIPFSKL